MKIISIAYVIIAVSTLFYSCKPRTRQSESNESIQWALMAKSMDDSSKNAFIEGMPEFEKKKIKALLKTYEQLTDVVEYDEYFLGLKVKTVASLENGLIRTKKGQFENGIMAYEYYNIRNTVMVDSARRYYPTATLYSRTIIPVDSTQQLYEEFYDTGRMKSRSCYSTLTTWHKNGNQSGYFLFNKGQVIQRMLWYENGMKKEESHWRNDRLNGPFQEWDSLGNQIRNVRYINGLIKK
ncbi:MAG: hypothetical protein WDA22_01010 [Bacteroidota bacterium]